MNYFDFWLHDFHCNRDAWHQTYFAILPLELLQKIFALKRKEELTSIKTVLHFHMLCRRRGYGRSIYNHAVLFYPYFSSNKIKIEHEVKVHQHKLSIRVKFSKLRNEYSVLYSDKQYAIQRPHFTICSETYFYVKQLQKDINNDEDDIFKHPPEYHYQIADWRFSQCHSNVGKCL